MFLGMTPDEWTAIGTMATALVALLAAGFAFAQVREARRAREERTRPFVVVDVQPSHDWFNMLNLVIENVGATVAYDVKMTFDPPLQSTLDDDMPLGDSVLVREGVRTMPPGRRIEVLFDASHDRYSSGLPMRYEVTVDLKDSKGNDSSPQRYVIDLSHYYGVMKIDIYGVHHIAKALRNVEKIIARWSDKSGRLKVWVRDEDRHLADKKGQEFLTGQPASTSRHDAPEVLVVLARTPLIRAAVESIPPLHRWLQTRLGRRARADLAKHRQLAARLTGDKKVRTE